jgi:hypothetical protein
LKSAFRTISRVRNLLGFTRWYLSQDCLLAAKQTMYSVEYRRFYLRDLESVVVWPSRLWLLRLIIPTVLLAAIGALFGKWVDFTAGMVFVGLALIWLLLEVALGPTANSHIRTTGTSVDLPLVNRTRRARKVLAKIDAAVRAARGSEQPTNPGILSQPADSFVQRRSETSSAASTATATETHAS